jgi:hypothetical protein
MPTEARTMNDEDRGVLDPRDVLTVNRRPVQIPGRDRCIRTSTVGGPEKGGDRRFYLSRELLADLLERARSSPVGRVQVDRAGVRVDLYERPDGHTYEVWTIIGADPRPEPMPAVMSGLVDRTRT